MTRHIPRRYLPALLAAGALHAETKSVTVSETKTAESVTLEKPTISDGEKHRIEIKNGSKTYVMDTVTPIPESDTDREAWRCVLSTVSAMHWRIIALKKTPLAYVILGGLTEILQASTGEGGSRSPKKVPFTVTVPPETLLTWRNELGSHADSKAKTRTKIAVGEQVIFSIKNSHLGNPIWTATGGLFKAKDSIKHEDTLTNESSVTWYAPKVPVKGGYKVTITFPKKGAVGKGKDGGDFSLKDNVVSVSFNVVVPSDARIVKLNETGSSSESGQLPADGPLSVKMQLHLTALPADVNYSRMNIAEDTANGADLPKETKGYFADYLNQPVHENLIHIPAKKMALV